MTFTIKVRTLPGSPMMCEYECPEHGRFERLVERDEKGDPPASVFCERGCDEPHDGCEYDDLDHDDPHCDRDCAANGGRRAELVVSAPSIKFWSRDPVPIGRASKSDEKDPRALDTEPLATGKMTQPEWRKWQKDLRRERRFQRKLKSGRISKRIQVGGG